MFCVHTSLTRQPCAVGIQEPVYEMGKQKLGFTLGPIGSGSKVGTLSILSHLCIPESNAHRPQAYYFYSSYFALALGLVHKFFPLHGRLSLHVRMFSALRSQLTGHHLRGLSVQPSHSLLYYLTSESSEPRSTSEMMFVHSFYLITINLSLPEWTFYGVLFVCSFNA